ncbi:MAG: UDP-N-acetylglucosamine 1-carboxyvinyltransferase [Planctomycetaceae bacterium]|nr:UDP-N-acetylglucosamine 1-carboxyvinyltransferase [Planctomycetota bacterium]NUN52085.1 UDP-N-acetylglucosamine 1-carboxyvinyltransferase [Planctomycetaceae bacterium]
MDKFVVEGGARLRGEVRCATAKNAVLPLMAATLLTEEPCRLLDVPRLSDVEMMRRILRVLGVESEFDAEGALCTRLVDDAPREAPWELVRKMRASISVLGPLLGKRRTARVSFPGGCVFGHRPIDLHMKGLRAIGAEVEVRGGFVEATAPSLPGGEVFLGGPFGSSVGATQNVLMAAVLAEGTTVIDGAACEPEVTDLCRFLRAMGAEIGGMGSPRLVVRGVARLSGAEHRPIPDRIEAGTFVAAAVLTDGEVTIRNCRPDHLRAALDKAVEMGGEVRRVGEDAVFVRRQRPLAPADIDTHVYPGFPTDMQAQFMVLQTLAHGVSVTTEKIYPDRFMHISELARLGAHVRKEGPSAIVSGVPKLSGAPVMASDLRASAALVLAGLVAEGTTQVHRVYHIDRGYERIEEKFAALGGRILRAKDDDENAAVEAVAAAQKA